MATLSATKAAQFARKNKQQILDDLENGTLSGSKNSRGWWQIDTSELMRVYDCGSDVPVSHQTEKPNGTVPPTPENQSEFKALEARLDELRQRLADKDTVIDDLRARLDTEGEERRKLTAMLIDARATNTPQEATGASRRGLFGWLRG